MLKKIFSFFFAIAISVSLFADPIEDMTQTEAQQLVEYLKNNPYLVDYCDCCDDVNGVENRIYAKLIHVESTEIVPCSYDDNKVSVKIKGTVIVGGHVNAKGVMEGVEAQGYAYENDNGSPTLATLNYHFAFYKGKVVRLGNAISVNTEDYKCNALKQFPASDEMGDNEADYKAYLKKNK